MEKMNNDKFKQILISNRIEVSDTKLKMLLSWGSEISNLKTEMFLPTLRLEIKRLANVFYSKEIDVILVSEFVSQIQKKRGKISCQEISFIFEEIINNETDISKYFSMSEVLRVVDSYLSLKTKVAKLSFEMKEKQAEELRNFQSEKQFQQESLRKYNSKIELTIYEKSAVGKHFEYQIENREILREMAAENIELEMEKLAKRNEVERHGFYVDQDMQVPVFWTESLLYGLYLYQNI